MYPNFVEEVSQILQSGNSLSMQDCRGMVHKNLDIQIKPGTVEEKLLEELVELALVKTARNIAQGLDPLALYDNLTKINGNQPYLNTRSSDSIFRQAYSTPIPLAYLASYLGDINPSTTVYEPSAGNGALLFCAEPSNCWANEIDESRCENLRNQGFYTTQFDAAIHQPNKKFDRIIANPPFHKTFRKQTYHCGRFISEYIDHAIAYKALQVMVDDGKASLILAGQYGTEEQRAKKYNSIKLRGFWKWLYDNYNVSHHLSIDGNLYAKQGAKFPVDLVVIAGRGKSSLELPAVAPPHIYQSFLELSIFLNK